MQALCATVVTIDEPTGESPVSEVVEQLPPDYRAVFLKTFLIIGAGLFLVFSLMMLLKRFSAIRYGQLNPRSYIKVIERRPISPKSTLYLIQLGDKKVMIAESQLEIRTLTELPPSENHDS